MDSLAPSSQKPEDKDNNVDIGRLIVQSSPVRVLKIVDISDTDTTNTKYKYLLLGQGCKLFHKKLHTDNDRTENTLQEFQVFSAHLQITGLFHFKSSTDHNLFVLSKETGRFLSIIEDPQQYWEFRSCSGLFHLKRWTKACIWLHGTSIVTLTALNELIHWSWKREEDKLEVLRIFQYKIPEIYYGNLYLTSQYDGSKNRGLGSDSSCLNHVVICSGTVFGQVHIWNVISDKPNVLYILEGHQGPVCYIELYSEFNSLISTSDDRTARLYTVSIGPLHNKSHFVDALLSGTPTISLVADFFGHTSRVYQGIVADRFIITSSDDSKICIWRNNTDADTENEWEIAKSWIANGGSAIRSIAYDSVLDTLFTGGDDGSVYKWCVDFKSGGCKGGRPVELFPGQQFSAQSWGNPRTLVLWDKTKVIGSMDKCGLKTYLTDALTQNAWKAPPGSKCSAVCFSPSKELFLGGTSKGDVFLMYASQNSISVLKLQCTDGVRHTYQILSNQDLTLTMQSITKALYDLGLRGTSPPPLQTISAAICHQNLLLLGDEDGVLYILDYELSRCINKLYNWHAKYGISSLNVFRDSFVSTGRDWLVKFFKIVDFNPTELYVVRAPFEWIDSTIVYLNDLICVGFKETKFLLYSHNTKQVITEIECGGAHRSYDFLLHECSNTTNSNNLEVTLAYIRNKQIHRTFRTVFDWLHPVKVGCPSRKINCGIQLIKDGDILYIATAGEVPLISIFTYNTRTLKLTFIEDLTGHVSSVRSLTFCATDNDTGVRSGYLFSGGGRSELIIWKLTSGLINSKFYLRHEKLKSAFLIASTKEDAKRLDFRILEIQTHYSSTFSTYFIFAACSDGCVHVLGFTTAAAQTWTHTLKKYAVLKTEEVQSWNTHSVSKIFVNSNVKDKDNGGSVDVYVYGVTTNGYFMSWNVNLAELASGPPETQPKSVIKSFSHQVTHNALTCCLQLEQNHDIMKVAFGCDDGTLHVLDFKYDKEQLHLLTGTELWRNDTVHNSTILGMVLGRENHFLASSVDQVVAEWNFYDGAHREMRAGVTDCQSIIYLDELGECVCCGDGLSISKLGIQPKSVTL